MVCSRRSWLAKSASVLAAGMVTRTLRVTAAEKLQDFSFVVVSDTHLGRQNSATPERQWRAAIAEINAAPGDFVLHLGDVVDSGRPEQYPLYAKSRTELKKPIYEIPGNHDPAELFEKHIRSPIDMAFDHAGVRFLLFGNSHTDSHMGFITAGQIAWLEKQCKEAERRDLRIVFACHVPIHKNLSPDRGWFVKPEDGQIAFYEMTKRYADRVIGCFHGHFHNGIRGWRDHEKMIEVLCPSVCYNQDRKLESAIQEKRTTGFFVNELRPGYVLVTLGSGRLVMRYKPIAADVNGEYVAEI